MKNNVIVSQKWKHLKKRGRKKKRFNKKKKSIKTNQKQKKKKMFNIFETIIDFGFSI